MSYLYRSLGERLKENLMAGLPTRTKSEGDYTGIPIPPCGEFAKTGSSGSPPWLRSTSTAASDESKTSLHREIVDFVQYMTPTAREIALRKDLVQRFTDLIASFKMNATVRPVGSYVTGLYIPTSDIDMVLTVEHAYGYGAFQARSDLTKISRKLYSSNFASQIDEVLNASVPLLRIIDRITGIQVDLTAADGHGIKATKAVQKWLEHDTGLIRALVLVLKTFLSIRKCGMTYTGGINSYVLVWMVVAWAHLEWKKMPVRHLGANLASLDAAFASLSLASRSNGASATWNPVSNSSQFSKQIKVGQGASEDYGIALKSFLKFYGSGFDYHGKAIKIEPSPSFVTKVYPYSRYAITQRYLLSIFDPADSSIDMGTKAYAIKHIQASFLAAYGKMATVDESQRSTAGILGRILDCDFGSFEDKRRRLSR